MPRTLFERTRDGLARLPRPTAFGVSFLVLTTGVGAYGVASLNRLLLVVFGLLLSCVIVSALLAVLNLRGLRVERSLPANVYAGERFEVAARIIPDRRSSDCFGIVLSDGPEGPYARPGFGLALRIRPGEPAYVRYRVRIKERGRHAVRAYRLSTRYPFGLFEYSLDAEVPSEILVFPRIGRFRADPLPGSRFSRLMTATETVREKGQEEFGNLREYRPGDNPRLIAWRASAHHGTMMVKELEDDLSKRVTIFLESRLASGAKKRDLLRLERAISFTATLVRLLARRRYWIQVYYLGPEPGQVTAGRGGRRLDRVMERLAVIEPTSERSIDELVRRAPDDTFWTSLPVLIVPTLDDRKLSAALDRIPGRIPPVVYRADGHWERTVFTYRNDGPIVFHS